MNGQSENSSNIFSFTSAVPTVALQETRRFFSKEEEDGQTSGFGLDNLSMDGPLVEERVDVDINSIFFHCQWKSQEQQQLTAVFS